ncbi:unnamed protein product, partial [marine sediment metagenome]
AKNKDLTPQEKSQGLILKIMQLLISLDIVWISFS